MKFTFINPYYEHYVGPIDDNFLPPTDLVNCATILQKRGIEVEIIDANIFKLKPEEVVKRINSDMVVVATSPINTWQCPPIEIKPYYNLVNKIRTLNPKPFIITVGPSTIFNPDGLSEVSDIVIMGQPENFFDQINSELKKEDYYKLDGIAFRDNQALIVKKAKKGYNLMNLPLPNFMLLPYKMYRWAVFDGPMLLLETSRGCPEGCSFCFQGITDYAYSSKKTEQIIDELRYIRSLGIKNVGFIDLEISVNMKKFGEWMNELKRANLDINWSCQIRMSSLENEDLIKLMSEAGCKVVMVGLESATDAAFKDLKKNKDKSYVYHTVRNLQKHGIRVLGFFILGSLYEETEKDIEKTIDYAKWLDVDYATFQIAIPYPTTKFHDEVKSLAKNTTEENIPVAYQKHFTFEKLKELKRKAYRRFYLRPGYILRNLKLLTRPVDLARNLKLFYGLIRN